MFYLIEKEESNNFEKSRENLQTNLTIHLKTRFNLSNEEVESLLSEFRKAFQEPTSLEWTFSNSCYFIIQLVSTIGKSLLFIFDKNRCNSITYANLSGILSWPYKRKI